MLRAMVFIDHLNFDIALQNYYNSLGKKTPKLDYNILPIELGKLISNIDVIKTFLFFPKPDDFLFNDAKLSGYYKWITGMKNQRNFDVIEGSYISRPVDDERPKDINDKTTYYKVEKGTDINLAVNAISKAFYNSYDVGFFMSADTDYLTVYNVLKTLGKLTVVVCVKGQNIGSLIPCVDNYIVLDETFFNKCERK